MYKTDTKRDLQSVTTPMIKQTRQSITILHIDPNLLFREGIDEILNDHPFIKLVGSVGDIQDALTQVSQTRPDLILLEFSTEEGICAEVIPKLLNESPLSKIILVTNSTDMNTHQLALKNGAIGIVEKKTSSKSTLLKAIEKVSNGEAWVDRQTVAHIINVLSNKAQSNPIDLMRQRIDNLTTREHQVISMVCQGMKPKELANYLMISESTARHYLSNIYAKLDLTSLGDLIIFAFTHGLVDIPE